MVTVFLRLERGLTHRDELWNLSMDMISHNFWFGVGPGSWGKEMFNYIPVMLDSYPGQMFIDLYYLTEGFNNSHNFYLVFFSDMGIIGLFTAILFPIVYFVISSRAIKKTNKKRVEYYIVIGSIAVGVGMFIRGFIEGINLITMGRISVDIPLWLVIAIIAFISKTEGRENSQGLLD